MNVSSSSSTSSQTLIGIGALALAAVLGYGALSISGDAGYAGVGPNFLPWVVAGALAVLGGGLVWEARRGGFRELEAPSGAERGDWRALAWVAAGIVANATLIERIGFILACALCFALAVRGLRSGEGRAAGDLRQTVIDVVTGMLIAAPVFWMFTKVLAVNLPGLTASGWI